MIKRLDSVLLNSENAKKLADFYENKVGLKNTGVYEMGDKGEEAYMYEFKEGSGFSILDHSDIKGKSKEAKRILLNFEVSDIDEAVANMAKNKVKMIQEKYHVEGYGYIATYEDLDGNYFQLVQVKNN
jgi:predicted enzyme related to lactoylglutathione lyase